MRTLGKELVDLAERCNGQTTTFMSCPETRTALDHRAEKDTAYRASEGALGAGYVEASSRDDGAA